MAEKYSAADMVLAVQAGFDKAAALGDSLGTPTSEAILEFLRDGQQHTMAELLDTLNVSTVPTLKAIEALQSADLVEFLEGQDLIEITRQGMVNIGSPGHS